MQWSAFRGPLVGERCGRYVVESAWSDGPLGPSALGRMPGASQSVRLVVLRGGRTDGDAAKISRELAPLRALGGAFLSPAAAWADPLGLVLAMDDPPATTLELTPRPPEHAARIVLTLASTLAKAHRAGLVHGLLAPALIHPVNDGELRISGLAVSRVVAPEHLASVADQALAPYLAPEVVRGRRARPSADVRALGMIFHALVRGRAPYAGPVTDVLANVSTDTVPALPADVPVPLRLAIDRAVARNADDRHEDARALARAIEEALGETPRLEVITGESPIETSAPIDELARRSEAESRGRAASGRKAARFTGALAKEQLTFARERFGEEAVTRALATLSPEDRDEIASASALSWIRVEAFARFHDAFARELGRSAEETHPELVRGGSRRTFGTLWRLLLRIGGPRLVMTRAPSVYDRTYDTGVMESRGIGDHGGQFVLGAWPDVPDFVLRGLRAGMSTALENVGRTGVVMTSERTSDGAIFTARWDP